MAQNASSGFPQASWLAQQRQVSPLNGSDGANSTYDPMQALAQQAIQNPNAGDQYQQAATADTATNPDGSKKEKPGWGPQIPGVSTMAGGADLGEIGVATVAGIGTGGLAYYLTKNNRHINHAENLEKIPGIGSLSRGMNSLKMPGFIGDKDWYKYWSLNYLPELDCKDNKANTEKLRGHIIQHQQGMHVNRSLHNFNKSIQAKRSAWSLGISKSKDLTGTYNELHTKLTGGEKAKVAELHQKLVREKLGLPEDFKGFESAEDAKRFYTGLEENAKQLTAKLGFNYPVPKESEEAFDKKFTEFASAAENSKDSSKLTLCQDYNHVKALRDGEPLIKKEGNLLASQPHGFNYPINSAEEFARATHFDHTHLQDLTKTDGIKTQLSNSLKNTAHTNSPVLENIVRTQDIKRAYLQEKVDNKTASPDEKSLLRRLKGTHDFLDKGVLQNNGVAGGNIREKAELTATMRQKGIGSIGKFYANTMHHMKNIFNGDMLVGSGSRSKAAMIPMLILGSLASSAMVIAPAIHAGNQADPGEKKKAFLENFVGFGIFNFIGWELGRRFLAATGIVHKVLGRHSLKHPLKFIGFSSWARRITLGGIGTEVIAMLAGGAILESVGKKIVDAFFPGNQKKKDKNADLEKAMAVSGQDTGGFGAPGARSGVNPPYFGNSQFSGNTSSTQGNNFGNSATGNPFNKDESQSSQYQDIMNSPVLKNADTLIKTTKPYGNSDQYGLSGA